MKISRDIPARTETFEIAWFRREFMEMSPKFREVRAKFKDALDKCWWCRHPFEDGEMMALVCLRKKGNKVFCQTCAGKIGDEDES
jgi:hypothetical protein